ncbi:hypothetical protein CVE36_18740 [Pseudomonas syringae pv. actinidiae]|nr:hypothetical protein [Pseudomonas syringae pv. actinidiae]
MHALSPFKNRAAAHRAMALAALHANSSLATRLARYNAHMTKARALETAGGVPNEQRPEFLPARRPALC